MQKYAKFTVIFMIILVGATVQVLLAGADAKDTPGRAALEFIKAYYAMDADTMSEKLCEADKKRDDVELIAQYVERLSTEAREMGFVPNYMKHRLYSVRSNTAFKGADEATVEIHAKRDRAIRCLFPFVARIFGIGDVYKMDRTLNLRMEDGRWKVYDFNFSNPRLSSNSLS